jgi:hypothetical protein
MIFKICIMVYRLEIKEDFRVNGFGVFGRFLMNGDELGFGIEHEDEGGHGDHRKNEI